MSIADLIPPLLARTRALRERLESSATRPSAEEIAADLSQIDADLVRLLTRLRETVNVPPAPPTVPPAAPPVDADAVAAPAAHTRRTRRR